MKPHSHNSIPLGGREVIIFLACWHAQAHRSRLNAHMRILGTFAQDSLFGMMP